MVIDAHSGAMGGSQSQEFMVRTPAGEDQVVSCEKCTYAANMEKATSKLAPIEDLKPEGDGKPLLVHTPGKGAIADVAEFLGISAQQDIKTVAYMAQNPGKDKDGGKTLEQPVVVFLRGDHMVNETKLLTLVKASQLRPMQTEELEKYFQGPAGYIGPIGLVAKLKETLGVWDQKERPGDPKYDSRAVHVLLDEGLVGRTNMICGANQLDYHFKNVTPGRDFEYTLAADLRSVTAGEACPNCGAPLRIDTAVEVGHIFKLGYKYSESMGARVLDRNGKEVAPIMGSYGIGIERILTAAVEQNNDENGFWLPPSIAPFEVVVVATNTKEESIRTTAEQVARQLEASGFDVLLDDRDERPGVKFKDADLVGIPFRINVGKKVTEGMLEVVPRSTRQSVDVRISAITEYFQKLRPAAR
jgi:prolyl-tRNA synthetase